MRCNSLDERTILLSLFENRALSLTSDLIWSAHSMDDFIYSTAQKEASKLPDSLTA